MRLNYEAAEMVQNALYAEKIEVPVKALSGKLYVRSLDLEWTGAEVQMSNIWGSMGLVPIDLLFRNFLRKVG